MPPTLRSLGWYGRGMGSRRLTPRALGQPIQPGGVGACPPRACPCTLGMCGVPACHLSSHSSQETGPVSSQGDGDHRGVLAEGRTRAAGLAPSSVAPTAAPAGGPRPPRLLSDSRCPPGPPRPRAPTLHLQQQGQPGPASSYSPLGSLLRIPAEGRPRAEAGAGGGPSPQSPRGWRPARGLLRGQPGPVGGPRENQTIPTPGGHTGPFQAKPHVLPVTQGPRRDGAGRGQPPLASKDTGLQARRTALAGVSAPWGLGGSRGPGNTCADPLGVGGPAAFVFSLWSLAWKGRARGLSVTLSIQTSPQVTVASSRQGGCPPPWPGSLPGGPAPQPPGPSLCWVGSHSCPPSCGSLFLPRCWKPSSLTSVSR